MFQLLNSPNVKKSTDIVDKVPAVFGFAVIISAVGSYRYGFLSSAILEDYL